MSKSFRGFNNMKEVLQGLIDQQVNIILVSGQKIYACVDAVVDNILVVSVGNRIVFVDIECICAVVTCCEEILELVLNYIRGYEKNYIKEENIVQDCMLFDYESKDFEI